MLVAEYIARVVVSIKSHIYKIWYIKHIKIVESGTDSTIMRVVLFFLSSTMGHILSGKDSTFNKVGHQIQLNNENHVHIKKSPDNKIFQNKLFYTYIKRQKSDNLYAKCDCIFYSLLF